MQKKHLDGFSHHTLTVGSDRSIGSVTSRSLKKIMNARLTDQPAKNNLPTDRQREVSLPIIYHVPRLYCQNLVIGILKLKHHSFIILMMINIVYDKTCIQCSRTIAYARQADAEIRQ